MQHVVSPSQNPERHRAVSPQALRGRSRSQGTLITIAEADVANGQILLPRRKRRINRRREDRGLPDRSIIESLYRDYRSEVDRQWPQVVGTDLLPTDIDGHLDQIVDVYVQKHRDGKIDTTGVESRLSIHGLRQAGMFYGRYSCEQSQVTSIQDQLRVSLERAHDDRAFVPFELVFADFALSGLTDDRPGFDGVREAMRAAGPEISLVYISEFHRASRSYRDWEDLHYLARRNGRILKSANGDFDSSRSDAEALIARGSATNVEEKARRVALVQRGRLGARKRGTSLGQPPLGYTRRQALDSDRRPRVKRNGQPIQEWVIDPVSKVIVEKIFHLFAVQKWSLRKIAAELNLQQADDSTSWKSGTVKRILRNEIYVGVQFHGRHQQIRDPHTGRAHMLTNPRSKWTIIIMPRLKLIPPMLYKTAWRRLAELRRNSKLTGKRWNRKERDPRTPFDGLQSCACCHRPITRSRSGKHAQYASVPGQDHVGGCQLRTSKSVRLVESCLAEQLIGRLLTDEMASLITTLANDRLHVAASTQTEEPSAIRIRIENRKKSIQNLMDGFKETTSSTVRSRLTAELEKEETLLVDDRKALEATLQQRKLEHVQLTVADVKQAFSDLRALFAGDVPLSAHMLRELIGALRIHEEPCEGRPGRFRWVASCTPQWRETICKLVPQEVIASVRRVIDGLGDPLWIVIDNVPDYQTMAPYIAELHSQGLTKVAIAKEIGKSVMLVTDALNFHFQGQVRQPRSQRPTPTPRPRRTTVGYRDIAEEVLRLRESSSTVAGDSSIVRIDLRVSKPQRAGVRWPPP